MKKNSNHIYNTFNRAYIEFVGLWNGYGKAKISLQGDLFRCTIIKLFN